MRTARQISAQLKKAKRIEETSGKIVDTLKKIGVTDLSKYAGSDIIVGITTTTEEEMKKKGILTKIKVVKAKYTPADADGFFVDERKSYKIINANGYTVEQLSTELPEKDYEYIEKGIKIPIDYGMGVEVIYEGRHYIFQRNGNWGKATVTLNITTWRGISSGAMHYYGKLDIRLPEMSEVGTQRTLSSNFFIPMYNNDTIELTQVLEQWEIDKYPENYKDYNHAGDRHRGFYTKKQLIDYAKKMFDEIFGEGWIFKIDD